MFIDFFEKSMDLRKLTDIYFQNILFPFLSVGFNTKNNIHGSLEILLEANAGKAKLCNR